MTENQKLFSAGLIAPWYLFPFQLGPYQMLLDHRFPFIEQSRRTGKTNEVLVWVLEELTKNEGWICRWCEPWKFQAREIVMPEIEAIQKFASKQDKFKYYTTDSFYENARGSRLYLRGVNDDKGESARGPKSHIIVADEYGSWKEPRYIINEVLLPQLLSTNGKLARLSTPPKDLGHKYYEDRERALRDGRFCQRIIWDAQGQLYEKKQIEEICEEVGGENSIAWKREFLCEEIGDPTLLVIPEFQEKIGDIVKSKIERPSHYDAYVAGDSGFDDNTFGLFGFYDFKRDVVCIEREYVDNSKTTNEHITQFKKIEKDLWKKVPPYLRTLDADKQKIYDIMVEDNYTVNRPFKAHKIASINTLRERVRRGGIEIHESCVNLIRQLRVGMWKDETKKDFQRTEGLGHLDGVAALMYFNRSIDTKKNPYPVEHMMSRYTHHISSDKRTEPQDGLEDFRDLYGG